MKLSMARATPTIVTDWGTTMTMDDDDTDHHQAMCITTQMAKGSTLELQLDSSSSATVGIDSATIQIVRL